MNIRPEQPCDIDKIRKIEIQAFETDGEAKLVDALRDSSGIELISLVAELEGTKDLIGHILFSPVTLDGFDGKIMGLGPMMVVPDWQKKGVGTLLINEGIENCKKEGYDAIVVLGHKDYYPRFGFVPAITNFGINSEYDVDAEVFMLKELQKDALKGISGTIKYHHAFKSL